MAERLIFENAGGMVTVNSPDLLKPGQYPFLANTRKLLGGRMTARPPMGANLLGGTLPAGATSVSRLNDPYLPGYALVVGAAGVMYVNATSVATGLSGNPLSFLPYRPAGTPRPWDYVADPSTAVTIPDYITSGYGTVAGMLKVRADGLVRKTGIKEPQDAPVIAVTTGTGPNWVTYRYIYRDSTTQAVSNPSPESAPQIVPQTSVSALRTRQQAESINPNTHFTTGISIRGNGATDSYQGRRSPGTLTDYIVSSQLHVLWRCIPSGVNIDGVRLPMNWHGQYAGTGVIANAALFYQGTILGEVKSPGITNQQTASTASTGRRLRSVGSDPYSGHRERFNIRIRIPDSCAGIRWLGPLFHHTRSRSRFTTPRFHRREPAPHRSIRRWIPLTCTARRRDWRTSPTCFRFRTLSPSFADTLSDLAIATNPILSYQNYEPFPSIDLPRSGTCTVGAVDQEVTGIAVLDGRQRTDDREPTHPSTRWRWRTGAAVTVVIDGPESSHQ